jgi:uncharacterized protein (UPF0261 family)
VRPVIAVLATLDTKGQEAGFLRERLAALGARPLLVDLGVLGAPAVRADVTRAQVARAGGTALTALRAAPTREAAQPVMAAGATAILQRRLARGELDGVVGLGGLQGTAIGTMVMRALPYGLPKIMVSTVASGDTSSYVGIADITMMFSVADILGLNAFMRQVLTSAAGAVWGMAKARGRRRAARVRGGRPLVGISNLGVLTQGTMHAQARFASRGYETIVFHAVGTGGRAMEQMMRQRLIGAVFDYAMGEVSDELFHGLRAGGPERMTVAGRLGLPQVIVPGGAEHVGILVQTPHVLPERWKTHRHVWHNEVVLAPRLNDRELRLVAREAGRRLQATNGRAVLMLPRLGTSRYAMPGGPLNDPAGDARFLDELKARVPPAMEVVERQAHAEDPAFVDEAVDRLIDLIERR